MATYRRRTTWRSIPGPRSTSDVEIGPFCVIGPHVRIGRGTRLENNVTIMGHVTIGEHNHIYPGVVIGGEPQDISYRGSDTQVDHRRSQHAFAKGSRSIAAPKRKTASRRSATTISSWPAATSPTIAGWADHIMIANGTLLGGHVHVHDHASLSGAVARAPLCLDRQLQLRRRVEPRAARRAAVHARRRASGPARAASTSWR